MRTRPLTCPDACRRSGVLHTLWTFGSFGAAYHLPGNARRAGRSQLPGQIYQVGLVRQVNGVDEPALVVAPESYEDGPMAGLRQGSIDLRLRGILLQSDMRGPCLERATWEVHLDASQDHQS